MLSEDEKYLRVTGTHCSWLTSLFMRLPIQITVHGCMVQGVHAGHCIPTWKHHPNRRGNMAEVKHFCRKAHPKFLSYPQLLQAPDGGFCCFHKNCIVLNTDFTYSAPNAAVLCTTIVSQVHNRFV